MDRKRFTITESFAGPPRMIMKVRTYSVTKTFDTSISTHYPLKVILRLLFIPISGTAVLLGWPSIPSQMRDMKQAKRIQNKTQSHMLHMTQAIRNQYKPHANPNRSY